MTAIVVLVILVALIAAGMAVLKRRAQRAAGAGSASVKRPNIDPFTVGEPWRRHVSSALSTERRFNEIVKGVDAGPLRDRLTTIGGQVHHGVAELFAIAKRGDHLDTAIGRIDTASINRQLGTGTGPAVDPDTTAALQSQVDAAGRMKATRDQTDQQLRTMNLRLGELVAQAAEVSVGGSGSAELGTALDDLVQQMEALRQAVADVESVRKGVTLPIDPPVDLPAPVADPVDAPQPGERRDEPGSAAAST